MIIYFWYPSVIQALGRKTSHMELFNTTHPSIVGFQETKKEVIATSNLWYAIEYLNGIISLPLALLKSLW
jgi:ABC-type amino acid transport system permease subunit